MNKKNIIAVLAILIVSAAGWALYSAMKPGPAEKVVQDQPQAKAEKQITDLSGQTKTFKTPCQRTVLMRGRDFYELAIILGNRAADPVVMFGEEIETSDKDAYRKFLEKFPSLADKPPVGDIYKGALDFENVISINPDLVVMDNFMARRKYEYVDQMKRAGLPLAFFDQSDKLLENPQKGFEVLGQLFNEESRAREINDFIDAQINLVKSRLEKSGKPMPTVYIEIGNLGPDKYSSTYARDAEGNYSSWGAMVDYARGKNIIDTLAGEMTTIDPEYLLKADPDIIIVTGANWSEEVGDSMRLGYYTSKDEAQKSLAAFTKRPGWNELKAVKNGQVYSIHHGLVLHFQFAAFQQMAKWFYPEEFADIDPEASIAEFHRRFMPIEYSGTWFTRLDN